MANQLKSKFSEVEDRIVNGLSPQEVFDTVSAEYSTDSSDDRFARRQIAKKIRFMPSMKNRTRSLVYRIFLIFFLISSAIIVFFNKQNRFEVFGFFMFNSLPSFFFFLINNIFVWIYLICAIAMMRWKVGVVWATISFTLIDLFRISMLLPDHLEVAPFMAAARFVVVFIVLILSILVIYRTQNRYQIDKKTHSIRFISHNPETDE